jgi:hypothetical protein
MKLETIKDFLSEKNVNCILHDQGEQNPLAYMEIFFEDKEKGDYIIEIAYIPDLEDEIDTFSLMQFVVPIRELEKDYPKSIDALLHNINRALLTPGFVCDPEAGLVYFRYVMPLSKDDSKVDLNEVLEIIDLLFFQVVQYAETIKNTNIENV